MDVASKITGDSYVATELNQQVDEMENIITGTGQSPSSGDLNQVGKGIASYASHGDFYADSGIADAYVLTATGSKQSPTAYVSGFKARFIVGNTNTGASTVNIATLGVKAIKRRDGTDLTAGDLTVNDLALIEYDGTNFVLTSFLSLATTTSSGIVELATASEADGLSDTSRSLTPSSIGNLVSEIKLAESTASSVTNVQFFDDFTSSFDVYVLKFEGVTVVTDNSIPMLRFAQSSVVQSGASDYSWGILAHDDATTGSAGNTSDSKFGLAATGTSNNSVASLSGQIEIYQPLSTSLRKTIRGYTTHIETSSLLHESNYSILGRFIKDTAAINGIEFSFINGSTFSGRFSLWGQRI